MVTTTMKTSGGGGLGETRHRDRFRFYITTAIIGMLSGFRTFITILDGNSRAKFILFPFKSCLFGVKMMMIIHSNIYTSVMMVND